MEIRSASRLHHPIDRVFEAYRDHMVEVAQYIPDVREIRIVKREIEGDVVKLHNEWVSDRDVPKIAARVIKPEHLRWDDYATWYAADRRCDWVIRMRAFKEAVACSGQTSLMEDDGGTRIELNGSFELDLNAIPGVPRFLTGRLGSQFEKFIVAVITPNFERTTAAIGRFLDERGG